MKRLIPICFALVAATGANARQNAGAQGDNPAAYSEQGRANAPEWRATKHAWEFGVGASVWQFNRMSAFTYTPGEESGIIDVKVRHVTYTGGLFAVRTLSNVFALDLSANIGKLENQWLAHAGLGLQWRLGHYFRSPWIDPYLRVGAGYMYNGYTTSYAGNNGEGLEYEWWNVRNKDGANAKGVIPVSGGVGVNMWLSDRFGIGMEGDYNYILKNRVANPLQGTVRLMWRFGGPSKRPAPTVLVKYEDRIVEKVVEKIVEVEKVVEVPRANLVERLVTLNELLSSIYFDYNKAEVKPEYDETLDKVKEVLMEENAAKRYLLSGFTDSHGSDAYNLGLSGRRVDAIRDALVRRGVPASMLKTRGHGKRIANLPTGASEAARMGDRKVTIEIITNDDYWNAL